MTLKIRPMILRAVYKRLVKPVLFQWEPEDAHERCLKIGIWLGRTKWTRALPRWMFNYRHPLLKQVVAGMSFENPIGLSAGFDKDGQLVNIIPEVGFGFMEIGTVTLNPYKGNPKPRLYPLV